jgi:hypothetical protein
MGSQEPSINRKRRNVRALRRLKLRAIRKTTRARIQKWEKNAAASDME